jgi:hypothetical protein
MCKGTHQDLLLFTGHWLSMFAWVRRVIILLRAFLCAGSQHKEVPVGLSLIRREICKANVADCLKTLLLEPACQVTAPATANILSTLPQVSPFELRDQALDDDVFGGVASEGLLPSMYTTKRQILTSERHGANSGMLTVLLQLL